MYNHNAYRRRAARKGGFSRMEVTTVNEWERRSDESAAAFEAFKIYLRLRSVKGAATELQKSPHLLYRWSDRYDWRDRARAYDNSILEDVRAELKCDLAQQIRRQYEQSLMLQDKSFANIKRLLESNPRSLKSLTELYFAARTAQWDLYDRIAPDAQSDEIKIVIEDAGGDAGERRQEN